MQLKRMNLNILKALLLTHSIRPLKKLMQSSLRTITWMKWKKKLKSTATITAALSAMMNYLDITKNRSTRNPSTNRIVDFGRIQVKQKSAMILLEPSIVH